MRAPFTTDWKASLKTELVIMAHICTPLSSRLTWCCAAFWGPDEYTWVLLSGTDAVMATDAVYDNHVTQWRVVSPIIAGAWSFFWLQSWSSWRWAILYLSVILLLTQTPHKSNYKHWLCRQIWIWYIATNTSYVPFMFNKYSQQVLLLLLELTPTDHASATASLLSTYPKHNPSQSQQKQHPY